MQIGYHLSSEELTPSQMHVSRLLTHAQEVVRDELEAMGFG